MPRQNQVTETKADKRSRPKVELAVAEELTDDLVGLAKLPRGPIVAVSDGTIQAQAARLADPWLRTAQRRILAAQIGQVQGNRHLQRVVAFPKRNEQTTIPRPAHVHTLDSGSPLTHEPQLIQRYPEISSCEEVPREARVCELRRARDVIHIVEGQMVIVTLLDDCCIPIPSEIPVSEDSQISVRGVRRTGFEVLIINPTEISTQAVIEDVASILLPLPHWVASVVLGVFQPSSLASQTFLERSYGDINVRYIVISQERGLIRL